MSLLVGGGGGRAKVGQTDAYFSRWGIVGGNDADKTWNMHDLNTDLMPEDDEVVVEQEPLENVLDRLCFNSYLGKGSSGRVYKCTLDGYYAAVSPRELVAKIPVSLFYHNYAKINKRTKKLEMNPLSEVENTPRSIDKEFFFEQLMKETEENFMEEFENFEEVCEPRAMKKAAKGIIGARITNLSKSQFHELRHEMAILQNENEGWKYIHKILHFDYESEIPIILSEACTGTLDQLRLKNPLWFQLDFDYDDHLHDTTSNITAMSASPHWKKVGWQLGQAVKYILKMGVAHTDMKPVNIFYKQTGTEEEHYNIQLADFGLCYPVGLQAYTRKNWETLPTGTITYKPKKWPKHDVFPPSNAPAQMLNPMTLTLFEFAAVMLSILYIPEDPEWPGVMHGKAHKQETVFVGHTTRKEKKQVDVQIEDEIKQALTTDWGRYLFRDYNSSSQKKKPVFWSSLMHFIMEWQEDNMDQDTDGLPFLTSFLSDLHS